MIFDPGLDYRLQNLLQVDLQSEFSIDISGHVVKMNSIFGGWVPGKFVSPAFFATRVPPQSRRVQGMGVPGRQPPSHPAHSTPRHLLRHGPRIGLGCVIRDRGSDSEASLGAYV